MNTVTLRFPKEKVSELPVVCCCRLFNASVYKYNANYMVACFSAVSVECKVSCF